MDEFIEENIVHYRSRLQMGAEPETRAALLKLLLDEEKELGRTREQLARIDRHIERLGRTIAQQEKLIGRVKFVGISSERALLMLSTLNDLMATYQLHRQWITVEVADGDGS